MLKSHVVKRVCSEEALCSHPKVTRSLEKIQKKKKKKKRSASHIARARSACVGTTTYFTFHKHFLRFTKIVHGGGGVHEYSAAEKLKRHTRKHYMQAGP